MSDWLLNLPVVWMAAVIFAVVLIAAHSRPFGKTQRHKKQRHKARTENLGCAPCASVSLCLCVFLAVV